MATTRNIASIKGLNWAIEVIKNFPLKRKLVLSGIINLVTFNLLIIIFVPHSQSLVFLCWFNIAVWIIDSLVAFYAKDIDWAYKIMTIYGLISTTMHAWILGGLYSSYLFWLPIITLGMSNFLSNAYAILSMVYSILIYTLFLYLQISGTVDFYKDIVQVPPLLDYMNYVCVVIMLGLIHYFFFTQVNLNMIWKMKSEEKMDYLENRLSQKELELQKMRNSMAQDFHDEMGNKLATITMLSNSLKIKLDSQFAHAYREESKTLEIIQQTASDVFEGTKDFIWSVDYKSDYTLELFLYLREFGERFFNNLDINFKSTYQLDTSQPYKLKPLAGRQLILIAKEIMTNAAKHSKCQDFFLLMSLENEKLRIVFKDFGKGFDFNNAPRRGLKNIENRCAAIDAKYLPHSDPTGTNITVIIDIAS